MATETVQWSICYRTSCRPILSVIITRENKLDWRSASNNDRLNSPITFVFHYCYYYYCYCVYYYYIDLFFQVAVNIASIQSYINLLVLPMPLSYNGKNREATRSTF